MTAIELMQILSYDIGGKLYLQGYEISFIRQRAKEEKLNNEEMEKLEEIIKNDRLDIQKMPTMVYDILDRKYIALQELKNNGHDSITIKRDIKNKIMSKNCKFYKDKDGDELDILNYKINRVSMYICKQVDNIPRTPRCWRKIFKDEKLNISGLIATNSKYKSKYEFIKKDIYMKEV